jgi:hypothetical protein
VKPKNKAKTKNDKTQQLTDNNSILECKVSSQQDKGRKALIKKEKGK